MKLKYYLRGLGFGLIVAALILGIHHVRSSGNELSDSEIRERAAKLGMVESSSRLVDDVPTTEEMLEEIEDKSDSEDAGIPVAEPIPATDDTQTDVTTDAYDDPGLDQALAGDTAPEETDAAETEETVPEETGAAEAEETVPEETDAAEAEETAPDTGTEEADETPALDYPTEDTTAEPSPAAAEISGSFTISSGDSSDRVARKLADAGFISSAAEFDRFLCAGGYDRVIRTGTYNIVSGMSQEEIARMITGR